MDKSILPMERRGGFGVMPNGEGVWSEAGGSRGVGAEGAVEPRPEITVLCQEVRTGWRGEKCACAVSPSVGTGRELGWEPVC